MKFLSHSNGLHTVDKEKLSKIEIVKRCFIVLFAIIALGFTIQFVTKIIDNSTLTSNFKFGRIDGNKMEYRLKGQGSYTVILDGDIGATLYEWEKVCDKLDSESKVSTFTYNRTGYGFNDGGAYLTPEEQAKALKALLKKSGASEPYILVGEQYGSLVLTNFAALYPDSVAGMVLINPIEESTLTTDENSKLLKNAYFRSKFEEIGSSFSLTSLLSKMNLTLENTSFKSNLSADELVEFERFENKKNYKSAVANEIKNLYYNVSDSQREGLLGNKPLYIITDDENISLKNLGSEKNTTVHTIQDISDSFSMVDPDSVVVGINNVIRIAQKNNK